jgi:hypothetical protein
VCFEPEQKRREIKVLTNADSAIGRKFADELTEGSRAVLPLA